MSGEVSAELSKEERKQRKREKKERKAAKASSSSKATTSLSSFLLTGTNDSTLDSIFANSKGPSTLLSRSAEPSLSNTKSKKEKKSSKSKDVAEPVVDEEEDGGEELANDAELSSLGSDVDLDDLAGDNDDSEEEEEEDEAEVEQAYAARQAAMRLKEANERKKVKLAERESSRSSSKKRKAAALAEEDEIAEALESDTDEEEQGGSDIDSSASGDDEEPRIEFTTKEANDKARKKAEKAKRRDKKLAHGDEPQEVRDARTIFLGNVPVQCSTSRPLKKALIRHVLQVPSLLSSLPEGTTLKADAVRFRSLAFASTIFGRKADDPDHKVDHSRSRAKEWRTSSSENHDTRGVRGGFREKVVDPTSSNGNEVRGKNPTLTDSQKRKVAFITGDLNEGKKVCNAYLVLAPTSNDSTLSPEEIVSLVVQHTNGTVFEGHTLRADKVRPKSGAATALALATSSTKPLEETSPTKAYLVPADEARRTLFLGGLDFAETEENVRVAVEACLVRERGPCDEESKAWVESVRLIRDASTGLGKGIGYVLLRDAECVDELLALPFGKPLKVSKRKPRLERCKSSVAAARAKAKAQSAPANSSRPSIAPSPNNATGRSTSSSAPPAKKPRTSSSSSSSAAAHAKETARQAALAATLATLPPQERKAVKAVDPDRVLRRAQKKKNKVLAERYARKQANAVGKAKVGDGILGRETRGEVRRRQEKKRVKEGNKTGKRAKF